MLSEQQKEIYLSLKVEIIDLNILAHCFARKINRFGYLYQNTTRHHMYEELISLRYMENGIILHLTNLDDDSSKYSFKAIAKEINRSMRDSSKLKVLNDLLRIYRRDVNSLKVTQRNFRIAHLNYDTELGLDEFLDFDKIIMPLLASANRIADLIWGSEINYGFKLGTYEGVLDFRRLNESIKIDITSGKGF